MKLISMTKFVKEYYSDESRDELQTLDLFDNYATFLLRPLHLGMFIGCDNLGNVIKSELEMYYNDAKENILFKGFEIKNKTTSLYYNWGEIHFLIFNNGNVEFFGIDNSQEDRPKYSLKTIEDLVKMHDIELTQSAENQIGIYE